MAGVSHRMCESVLLWLGEYCPQALDAGISLQYEWLVNGGIYANTGAAMSFSFKVSKASWHSSIHLNSTFFLVSLCSGWAIAANCEMNRR